MKTSNIILLTMIGSITIVIISGALQLRFTGLKKSEYAEASTIHDLKEFRYLVIRQSLNLAIATSETTNLVIRHAKDQNRPVVRYREAGDTLFIDEIKFGQGSRTLSVTLKTPLKNLKWITARDAAFSLQDFPSDFLHIDLNNSRLYISGENQVKMGTLEIKAVNQSHVDGNNVQVDTLEVDLDHSELRMPDNIYKLKGSIKNHATIHAPQVTEIEFRKDSLSRPFY
ncbi:MAG: hypothetical protein WD824_10015 [Cyclobacteriaceae bacterium]